MKLIEALKYFSIENLDTEELLIDCQYRNTDSDKDLYDKFVHNIKALCYDEEEFDKLCNIEMTPEFLQALKNDENDDYYDENINQHIFDAAWLVDEEIDYEERKANDDYDDLYAECARYEICFGDFDFKYEYENDVDLT